MIVGIVGGGQLARMLALAGTPLGLRFQFLDPAIDACAGPVGELIRAEYDDVAALERLAERADRVTFEFENVPGGALERLADRGKVYPPLKALATSQDRLLEKTLFREQSIPVPAFVAVDDRQGLEEAVGVVGLPAVLKTRRLGYDGKGQAVIRAAADLDDAWTRLGGVPLILEGFVPFDRELSIIAARGPDGATVFYPVSENVHREGILRLSRCRPGDAMQKPAEALVERLLRSLDYVGVLALELFQVGDELLANEFAPRVHNSGHWTIEGARTSQFENHLRAILGFPLGDTAPVGHSAMLNFIGEVPDVRPILAHSGAHLHVYGKEARPGRKVGHVTLRVDSEEELQAGLERLQRMV